MARQGRKLSLHSMISESKSKRDVNNNNGTNDEELGDNNDNQSSREDEFSCDDSYSEVSFLADRSCGSYENKDDDDTPCHELSNGFFQCCERRQERNHFRTLRLRVLLVGLVVMISGGIFTYYCFYEAYQRNIENDFQKDATQVLDAINRNVEATIRQLDILATSILSSANDTNQRFPFVTINHFGLQISKSMALTGIVQQASLMPIIYSNQLMEWEMYSASFHIHLENWITDALQTQNSSWYRNNIADKNQSSNSDSNIWSVIHNWESSRFSSNGTYLQGWQTFPLVDESGSYRPVCNNMTRDFDLQDIIYNPRVLISEPLEHFGKLLENSTGNPVEPTSIIYYPIVDNIEEIGISVENRSATSVRAFLSVSIHWSSVFSNIFDDAESSAYVVQVKTSCPNDQVYTYIVEGSNATWIGNDDLNQGIYKGTLFKGGDLSDIQLSRQNVGYTGFPFDTNNNCMYHFTVHPFTEILVQTNRRIIANTIMIVAFVAIPFGIFLVYMRMFSARLDELKTSAQRSNDIVSSLFPAKVHEKLYKRRASNSPSGSDPICGDDNPIAELYPETTVMFADIAGFTAWSSVRDPNQVFTLLESIYRAFDETASLRKVFKVETIGDCYVAVAGLPEPRKDHAIVMARFAYAILADMITTTLGLEKQLGPGTSALILRIGLNSGPTTAGVLRGAKGRFQLFGDTVNTAARMESNSHPGRILCSEKTNDLIVTAGKEHWMTRRQDLVVAKGKGEMQCFWCDPKSDNNGPISLPEQTNIPSNTSIRMEPLPVIQPKGQGAEVEWVVEVFEVMLHTLLRSRGVDDGIADVNAQEWEPLAKLPRDEVSEIIPLSNGKAVKERNLTEKEAKLRKTVRKQLRKYVTTIAKQYRDNPFHNFQHACHVVMATKKLLLRVIKPDESSVSSTAYGITSDPLTQFAIVFSALIHDVDHPGVSNAQLVKEEVDIAQRYKNLSVAEQNSISIAWTLLMQPKFSDLRMAIMPTEADCSLFRKIIVNSVMATDLFDKDLKLLRENRWNKAFAEKTTCTLSRQEDVNRCATIAIEHIIQASDVSHTMQHWQVYQTWNRKLFREIHQAYQEGRCEKDPVIGWYDGELWFFDNYIIPLAKKLKTCGVFGVSCDELLDYATDNRAEWAIKGKDIVAELIALTNGSKQKGDDTSHSNRKRDKMLSLGTDRSQRNKKKSAGTKVVTVSLPFDEELSSSFAAVFDTEYNNSFRAADISAPPIVPTTITTTTTTTTTAAAAAAAVTAATATATKTNHDDSIQIDFDMSVGSESTAEADVRIAITSSQGNNCTGLFETWPTVPLSDYEK